jgi:hypothetical protein
MEAEMRVIIATPAGLIALAVVSAPVDSSTSSPSSLVPSVDEIRAKVCAAAFGSPLASNIYRGLVAEIIVGAALGPEWELCSGDWRGWDCEHPTGLRLEVKQSAARQTWTGTRKATVPIFDIRTRTGYFDRADGVADPRRFAHINVFAHHPIMHTSADHRGLHGSEHPSASQPGGGPTSGFDCDF